MLIKTKRFYLIGLALAVFCLISGNRIATMQQQSEGNGFLPPTPAPAAGIQLQPQIAKGANTSLAVWADRRTVLGRYVPDDNAGIGSDTDIYAARYDAQGNLIDTMPIVVNEAIYEQYLPHVAWNGQNWLVTWITKRRTNQFNVDILAVRIAPDGRILDSTPIPIYITPDSGGAANYLSASSDGVNWTVVFGLGGYNSSINAVRVAPDGSLVDTTPKVLFQDTNFTAPFQADIAFANNQFLVAWEELGDNAISGIRAQRFNNNLDAVGASFVVASDNSHSPRVASDGTNFFVSYIAGGGGGSSYTALNGARVTASGQVLDPNGIVLHGGLNYYILLYNNALAWDGTAYVAASHLGNSGADGNIYVTRVSNSGTILNSSPIVLGNSLSNQPAVAALPNGGAKVVWIDHGLSADGDIFGANVLTNNTAGTAASVSNAAPRQTNIRFAKTEAGNFAYSYRSTISGVSSVYLQRLDANGDSIGEPTLVIQGAETIMNPAVAWNGTVYLVVWELNSQTFGRIVAADGTTLGAVFSISVGNMPDVAALGTQFLVVVSFPETSQIRNTRAVRVDGNGTVLGAPVKIGNNFDLRPRVRAFSNRWLVVWESDISHDNPNSNIAAAFVEANGTTPGEFSIASSGDAPHLAIGGDTALVVWQNGGKIYGRRVRNDGAFLGNSFLVAQSPRTLYAAAAAWDGSRFIVTFADSRNSTMLPPADIWATLVGLDGTILTPANFSVAASPLPEEMPAVEAANGTTIFGYSQFDDRAPYTSYRARLRKFPFDANFNVSVTPYQRQIAPGAATTYTVNVNAQNNFNGAVELSVFGLPAGATATFSPTTITGSGSATLTVTTSAATPEDIYRLTITATSGARQSTTEAILFVDDMPPLTGYAVTDLGTLGGTQSAAYDINQSGQIVGYAFNAAQKRRAFLYANGQMQDLGTLGGETSAAYGVSDSGKVAGDSGFNESDDQRAFFYDGATMRNLGVYQTNTNADYSYGNAVNNSNQVVGLSSSVGGALAFLFQNNQMTFVGSPFAFDSAYDINNAGKIVGSEYVGGGITKSYIINSDNTNPILIEPLGGRSSYAYAINNNNQVVGSAEYSPNNIFKHAFLYSNGQLRDINGFNAPQSFAYNINDAGLIVGSIYLTSFGDPRAFVHDGATMRNLNSLIPQNSGWVLQEARGINNAGQIVGFGLINSQKHAFLLNPNGTQNTPPTVQIISPTTNSNVGQADAITISADAFDADGAITRVEFYADGALIGAATSQPYTILWTNAIPNHTYTLTAKAFDNAGAATVSAPVTITVGGSSQNRRTKFDFDGDGKADLSVFRPDNGVWYLNNSTSGFTGVQFGVSTDKLVPADYDGDGKTDIAVYRGGIWYLNRSQLRFTGIAFGDGGDVPQPADYDGDGKSELAVFRPSNGVWYVMNLVNNQFTAAQFGQSGDAPVAADYDGDGKADYAVYRAGIWYLQRSTLGFTGIAFGEPTDKPVASDYDGDGKADVAVFRPSNGVWYLQRSAAGFTGVQFGVSTDKLVPADYDGDGKTDIAVFRNGVWYLQRSTAGFTGIQFGSASDISIPAAYLP